MVYFSGRVKFQLPDFRKLILTGKKRSTNSSTRPSRMLLSRDNSTCPKYRRVIMISNSLYIPRRKSGSPEDSSCSAESCRKRSHSFLRRTGFSVSSAIEGGVELGDYIKEKIKKKKAPLVKFVSIESKAL